VVGRPVRAIGNRGIRGRSVRRRKNPLGANLDRDELHDDLQLSGGDVPSRLCRARHGADRRRHDDQQRQRERVVSDQLLHPANDVSDDLRPGITFAVIVCRRVMCARTWSSAGEPAQRLDAPGAA